MTRVGYPPSLFVIGAQKAGTTFLANLLDQHPNICLASPKEPHYFTQHRDHPRQWYRDCFSHAGTTQILVDASTSYSAAPVDWNGRPKPSPSSPYAGVPERIAEVSPDARFVYIVRDPVARMYSAYWHNVRTEGETRTFLDAISANTIYRRISNYEAQLSLYRDIFPESSIIVLRFEDLIVKPVSVANCCFRFLDVAENVDLDTQVGRNRSFVTTPALRALDFTLRGLGGLKKVYRHVRRVMPSRLINVATRAVTRPIPPLDPAIREQLLEEFEPMAVRFYERTGVQIHPWSEE